MQEFLNKTYIGLRKHRNIFEKFIFPVMLLLYPFINIGRGVDVTDTAYSLGNFLYPDKVDNMWMLSTYLHQVTGQLLMRLPWGETLIGMRFWSTLFICASALCAYYLLQAFLPPWMIFIGEWVAISLCWCPSVILYNIMTYMFFTLGMLFLARGLASERRSRPWLFAAGVMLGLNVTVRLPNIVESLAIVVVIAYALMTGKSFLELMKEILMCVAGFAFGFLIPFAVICARYGSHAYFDMIVSLSEVSGNTAQYSALGMLSVIFFAYMSTVSKMLIMLPCIAAGFILFTALPEKYITVKRLVYIAGIFLLVTYYFKTGTFTFNYWYYDSIFNAAMMFVIISAIFLIADIAGFLHGSYPERMLSMTALVMILITPIGSNNYTYPILNCLFFVAPVCVGVFRRVFRAACGKKGEKYRSRYHLQHFAWVSMSVAVLLVLIIQGTLFHAVYSFRDGDYGVALDTYSKVPKLQYVKTTAGNASALDALYEFIDTAMPDGAHGEGTVFWGDVPGLSYIMDLKPAIFSTWPELDSVSTDDFADALDALSFKPLIIIGTGGSDYEHSEHKYNLLLLYMEENNYSLCYNDGTYRVYTVRQLSEDFDERYQ